MKKFVLFALCIPFFCAALEYMPWHRRDLELYPELSYRLQQYDRVNGKGGAVPRSDLSHFLTAGISSSYTPYGFGLETTFAHTRHRTFGFDDLRINGSYIWMNDITGDMVSLLTGVTFIKAITESVHDISSFHHSKTELELYASIGRECSYRQFWLSRWWGVFALGVGDTGSPWMRGNLAWEKNWPDCAVLRLSLDTLWGLGGKRLDVNDFKGYGPIRHRSVDLGVRYTLITECWGMVSLGYSHRLWARNFPQNANNVYFSILYPFGL